MVTVAVIVYKDDKIIVARSKNMPEEYLAGMATSLKFENYL